MKYRHMDTDSNIRIVIGGPPNSGKSIFAVYLFRALREMGIRAYHYDYDPYSPTRELILGMISKEDRERLKTDVTSKGAKIFAGNFQEKFVNYDIVIGDLPGRISEILDILASAGTHGLIVCSDEREEQIQEWKNVFRKLNINIICIVKTNLVDFDKVDEEIVDDGVIFAEISGLERENIPEIVPTNIRSLAKIIKKILQI